ncbi:MAG: hypothetical protein KDA80_04230 [Planctomycetaceae bacterium]|nr:hypothetical protein [Planctomycetaceae bacterium]
MEQILFDQLDSASQSGGPKAAIERLISNLQEQKQLHELFDARMLARKFELGLPLSRPSSLQDVPEEKRKDVEKTYVEAARETGEAFLAQGDIQNGWMYLQVIREPEKVAKALDQLPDNIDDYERLEGLLQIALYQGVNPIKGVKWMLKAHGTCSTITALDQALSQMSQEYRNACAKLMVRHLHEELTESVRRHVEQRIPMLPPGQSLAELIQGRDWLFEGGNYHIDVSHLNSVVRFARSIEAPAEELKLAADLAEYGRHLDPQFQYDAEPPFDEFYPAHIQFFNVLLDRNREEGLQYFRDKLEAEPDEQDKPLLAYVLVDLLIRSEHLDEAVDLSAKYLANLGEDVSISFEELCVKAGRLDTLKQVRKEQGNAVGYVAAMLHGKS